MNNMNKINKIKQEYITILLAGISILLVIILFFWINYLVKNNYISENFETNNINNVNVPLTTTYSCTNFCGPTSRCATTGQQCMADIDCPGCQPNTSPTNNSTTGCVPGNNGAGKLTFGVTPQYSTLTTDIGTDSPFFTNKPFTPPPKASFGIDTWSTSFKQTSQMFQSRYTPSGLQFMPNYSNQNTVTGLFTDDGPLASNDYITPQ